MPTGGGDVRADPAGAVRPPGTRSTTAAIADSGSAYRSIPRLRFEALDRDATLAPRPIAVTRDVYAM
jgi:hypothetical protein